MTSTSPAEPLRNFPSADICTLPYPFLRQPQIAADLFQGLRLRALSRSEVEAPGEDDLFSRRQKCMLIAEVFVQPGECRSRGSSSMA